jgi:hypothetical protein
MMLTTTSEEEKARKLGCVFQASLASGCAARECVARAERLQEGDDAARRVLGH